MAGVYEAPILVVNERQKRILDLCSSGIRGLEEIASRLECRREDLMRDVEELRARGLVEVRKDLVEVASLTEEGARYLSLKMPEERLGRLLEELEEFDLADVARIASEAGIELREDEVKVGLLHLARLRAVRVEGGRVRLVSRAALSKALAEAAAMREALASIKEGRVVDRSTLRALRRRRLVSIKRTARILVCPTGKACRLLSEGRLIGARVITALTPEVIVSGAWRGAFFKKYDLSIPPPRLYPGRKHPYLDFLDMVRELLVAMGFEEMKGPHVELELWNFDVLFQAQDHPARDIHDTFYLKYPERGRVDDDRLLERVKAVHEYGGGTGSRGWRYRWDPLRALRLVLRTQTTAVSVRTLYERGEGEYRCFALDRVFRPESLDAKHSMEFYQLEGIIVGRGVTFRHLLGFFNELARELGLGPVKVKPAYFPFTEPSVEGFIKHRKLGWMEVFPGGMFRPEVLWPLGVRECNVAAWGIGIDRIAMAVLDVDDIRLLFSQDLEFLRSWKSPLWVR
ncbi:MAG: phenylalanine--tRNA ligase subunit alpha [Thermoprotei archaeon]|nr:MAG: phenylalanine--tRNA ligase subunit alpha [Thermoprotei archaeon]